MVLPAIRDQFAGGGNRGDMSVNPYSRYILNQSNSAKAIEQGLAEADWYTSPIPRDAFRRLLQRRDAPAMRDALIWLALLIGSGYAGYRLWGTWWAVIPFAMYGVLYASSSDARWHEAGHGTAFRTNWLNNALYEIASFMVMRESTSWRWSHARHHSDTIIVGRDPEIAVPRPPKIGTHILGLFGLPGYPAYFRRLLQHARGKITEAEQMYVPQTQYPQVIFKARIHLVLYLVVIALAVYGRSILPLMYIGLPALYGAWLMSVYGKTQHAGLAENVLDHRLNCRTVYMNRINRFLYLNMNYHVEHHMFPLVPYYNLPRLHELVKDDMPRPYSGLWEAWREIIPAILRQRQDPGWCVKRILPTARPAGGAGITIHTTDQPQAQDGWIEACPASAVGKEEVIRFDHGRRTYAIYQTADGRYCATEGVCTHGNTHLADGLVRGCIVECPKHNGRFDVTDGSARRAPACAALRTYPVENRGGRLHLNLADRPQNQKTWRFRVVSNENVATFIKELVLEPQDDAGPVFTPGDYLQFDIPAYESIAFTGFAIQPPFEQAWQAQHVFDYAARNPLACRRNYSLASSPAERLLRFNVRIAMPPRGQECPAGAGSSYVFNLKPGATVSAIGPFGDFHIKPTQKEMLFIGRGAGMAPLRSQLSHLLETQNSPRKIEFWYEAHSGREVPYADYFQHLADRHANFRFHVVLSSPSPEDRWTGHRGLVHEVVQRQRLAGHSNLKAVEYYLCGPPTMIKACTNMLRSLGVEQSQIAYDEF